jgi:hypothetical protein
VANKEFKDIGMGDLNPVESPIIKREITTSTKHNRFVIDAAFESFGHDIWANAGPYKALALRSWQEAEPSPSNFWNIFSDGLGGQITMIKARIPEVHHYPVPESLEPTSGPHQSIIEMYPTYVSKELNMPPPEPGTLIWVDYEDRTNFKHPIYLGPVKVDALSKLGTEISNLTSGATSAIQAFMSSVLSGLTPGQAPVHPVGPWAGKPNWKNTKVGLPTSVRPPGARGSAGALILAAAHEHATNNNLGEDFVTAMYTLGKNETALRLGLPAGAYYNPPGDRRISAWGVFQWQDRHVKKYFGLQYAWQMSYDQEIRGSLPIYVDKFQKFAALGNGPQGIFMWHAAVREYNRLLKLGTTNTKHIQGHTKGASGRSWRIIIEGYMKKYYARKPEAQGAYKKYLKDGAPSFEKSLNVYLSTIRGTT